MDSSICNQNSPNNKNEQNPAEYLKFKCVPTQEEVDDVDKYMIETGILEQLKGAMSEILEEQPHDPLVKLKQRLEKINKDSR